MKKLYYTIILTSLLFSCAKQSDVDCLNEKLQVIEKYDRLLDLASDDTAQYESIKRERDAALSKLDC